MSERIEFTVPLPPVSWRKNSRATRWYKTADAVAYSETVYATACDSFATRVAMALSSAVRPWARARVSYEWRYCGTKPDPANVPANVALLQDILCMAPNVGIQRHPSKITYLGLIEDDKHIEPSWTATRVRHRTDECVRIEIERLP